LQPARAQSRVHSPAFSYYNEQKYFEKYKQFFATLQHSRAMTVECSRRRYNQPLNRKENHMGELVPIFLFGMVAWVIKFTSDNKLRRYMLDKGVSPETMQMMMSKPAAENVPSSLKWGLVLTAVGAGAFFGLNIADGRDEYTISCMLVAGGLALIAYYLIAARITRNA
jgi:hypothetical protein